MEHGCTLLTVWVVLDRDLIVRVWAVPGCNQGVVQTRVVLYLSSNLLLSMPSEGQSVRTAGLEGTGLNYLDELLTPSTAGVELIHPSCFAQRWALVVFQFQEIQ